MTECGVLATGEDWPTDYSCVLPCGHAGEHHYIDAMSSSRERIRWESLSDKEKQAESLSWWLH